MINVGREPDIGAFRSAMEALWVYREPFDVSLVSVYLCFNSVGVSTVWVGEVVDFGAVRDEING